MSKKPDTAAALAGILKAKRGDDQPSAPAASVAALPEPEKPAPPSPALPDAQPSSSAKARSGKSSDKANYRQFSVYLRKDTRKKVGRTLEDGETGQDFSELVQQLLEQWLASNT